MTGSAGEATHTAQVDAVLDEGLICHIGYDDAGPVVIPAVHARVGDVLYLRIEGAGRLAQLATGGPVRICATVTLTDGIVLGRSQFHQTLNYRSAVIRGEATLLGGPEERATALTALVEHLLAGRATHSRPPDAEELGALAILRLPIEVSDLIGRSGPPNDDPEDAALPHWAGVLGIRPSYGPPWPAQDLPYGRQVPAQIANYSRTARPQGYR